MKIEVDEEVLAALEADRNIFSALLCAIVGNDWDLLGGVKTDDGQKEIKISMEQMKIASDVVLNVHLSDDKESIIVGVKNR